MVRNCFICSHTCSHMDALRFCRVQGKNYYTWLNSFIISKGLLRAAQSENPSCLKEVLVQERLLPAAIEPIEECCSTMLGVGSFFAFVTLIKEPIEIAVRH